MYFKYFLLMLTLCLHSFYSSSKGQVCLIKQDGILIEKRHIDDNKNINCLITYDMVSHEPIDSVMFAYSKMKINSVKVYSYTNGHFEKNELISAGDNYLQAFDKDKTCKLSRIVLRQFLLEYILSNLCILNRSTLTSGKDVSQLAIISQKENTTKVEYDGINSKFNSFPEIFQVYFSNEILKNLSLQAQDGVLQNEKYTFTTGTFTRSFIYKGVVLNKVVLQIRYNSGKTVNSVRIYEIES